MTHAQGPMEAAKLEASTTAPLLRIYMLGPLDIAWEGQPTPFLKERLNGRGVAPSLGLLKALLSRPDRFALRDWLLEQFWPESAVSSAQERLDDVASGLRTLLRPPGSSAKILQYVYGSNGKGSGYRLEDYPLIWVDADAFIWFIEQAARLERFGQDALPLWEQAYQLGSRGSFLPEEEYSDWAKPRREEIAGQYRQCVHRLTTLLRERGATEQALLRLRIYWQAHPMDEDVLRPLMELLGEQERFQEAEAYYQQLLRTLKELGLEEAGKPQEPDSRTTDIREYLFAKRIQREANEDNYLIVQPATHVSLLSYQQRAQSQRVSPRATPELLEHSTIALPISSMQQDPLLNIGIPDCPTRFGLALAQTITLIEQWYGMALFCHHLQDQLDRNIKSLDILKAQYSLEAFTLSRRSFLITLAALPAASLAASSQALKIVLKLEEFLPQCAASITACWHLSGGSNLDAIAPIIDAYLPTLITVMKTASSYREGVANLIAQCYVLKAILSWHVEGLAVAEAHCRHALHYSDIAKNPNLKVTALNQHALIAYYAKQFAKALSKSEEAYTLLQNSSHEYVFPIVQGRVYMYLAAIQAQQSSGNAEQTLEKAQHSFTLQATATEPVPLYADCGNAPLTLWAGLTHYHLSAREPGHAERALTSLKTFGLLQPDLNIPERFRLECLNNQILAAVECNELEEAIVCLEAGRQGARALESRQRNTEVEYAYQEMLKCWPREERVQVLNVVPESMQ